MSGREEEAPPLQLKLCQWSAGERGEAKSVEMKPYPRPLSRLATAADWRPLILPTVVVVSMGHSSCPWEYAPAATDL